MHSAQTTSHIMMIRPASFGFNEETAVNNAYQHKPEGEDAAGISARAREEFDRFVAVLQAEGVDVVVLADSEKPEKPDAVFPNNWISFHRDNVVITYPMFSPKRRQERREEIIEEIEKKFQVERRYSFEYSEEDNQFLEGTGSMVLDREHQITYACLSPRTNIKALDRFCLLMGYEKVVFHALDEKGAPIYHTNVMMALGKEFAVVCLDAINDEHERKILVNKLESTGKEIIPISFEQKNAFAGNMLEVRTATGEPLIIMSDTAYRSLSKDQVTRLMTYGRILHPDIPTIERFGGGSVRCMMAEVFLEERTHDDE